MERLGNATKETDDNLGDTTQATRTTFIRRELRVYVQLPLETPETFPPIPPRCQSALNTVQTFCGQKLSSWMVRNASYLRRRGLHAKRRRWTAYPLRAAGISV